jgi:pseudouridine synthase
MAERVQKIIAAAGICSRRKAEGLIEQGRVKINGQIARIGNSADPNVDTILVDGIPIDPEEKVYFILNKPVGYESTLQSTTGNPTVIELMDTAVRIFPVGRLDTDSRGLLLLTNDGEFANMVMHPGSLVEKVYRVSVNGHIPDARIDEMRQGIELEEATTRPCEIEILERDANKTILLMTLHEGRKRQIRRMVAAIGFSVMDLRRESVGNIVLAGLKEGGHRHLTMEEIRGLQRLGMGDS